MANEGIPVGASRKKTLLKGSDERTVRSSPKDHPHSPRLYLSVRGNPAGHKLHSGVISIKGAVTSRGMCEEHRSRRLWDAFEEKKRKGDEFRSIGVESGGGDRDSGKSCLKKRIKCDEVFSLNAR